MARARLPVRMAPEIDQPVVLEQLGVNGPVVVIELVSAPWAEI
jgi:hypothetical protein